MALPYDLVQTLQDAAPKDAWAKILKHAWTVCSEAFGHGKVEAAVARRDREVGEVDHYLATAGWDLWTAYEESVPLTSEALASWWARRGSGRAVLILDALSLREAPWLLSGAKTRGYTVHEAKATGAELPPNTTAFAKALGFGQRSSLANNGAGKSHKLKGAHTESTDIAWHDCANLIKSEPDWVFWHHWPDHRLHDYGAPGKGLSALTQDAEQHLTSDEFWELIARLATGRRLVITSDHGYAASGLFTDSVDKDQADYLKKIFKSGRCDSSNLGVGPWVPPIVLELETRHGKLLYVNGRRKWKSAGGYPTLTHGGLSVLEVTVPFIELSRPTGA